MKEREFLIKLQNRVKEQEQLMNAIPYPGLFTLVAKWLSDHPWRYLIPLALLISVFFRISVGHEYTDFILWLFSRL